MQRTQILEKVKSYYLLIFRQPVGKRIFSPLLINFEGFSHKNRFLDTATNARILFFNLIARIESSSKILTQRKVIKCFRVIYPLKSFVY